MSLLKNLFWFFTIIALPHCAFAEEATITYWDELVPSIETIDDPFTELDQNQLYDLATLVKYEEAQLDPSFKVSEASKTEMADITNGLKEQGIEVDTLFEARAAIMEQRRQLATLPNSDILNSQRKVPGYITPIEMEGTKVIKFFLVPAAGACIHTPPPPPNQLVLVDYPEGIELVSLSTPVWVSGHLYAEESIENVSYADGASNVESVYTLTASEVELYQP